MGAELTRKAYQLCLTQRALDADQTDSAQRSQNDDQSSQEST
jgi:hypothetical protein